MKKNPYTINFGRIPSQYISRELIIDTIIDTLDSEEVDSQAFKLTGLRGTGKTVTLTAIEKKMKEDPNWIVIGVKSCSDISQDIISQLYSSVPFLTTFIDASLNLSKFGIGLNISAKSPVTSLDFAFKELLNVVNKRGMRVLVTIDEARKTDALIDFVQTFQLLIREDLPIYMIAAGLYEDIESIENTDGLTFFLRAEKYEMTPLNYTTIRSNYMETLEIPFEIADQMAIQTKGYPFAYQAFGKYMWESEKKELSDIFYAKVDEALAEKVYKKLWSELAPRDKFFLKFIADKENMSAVELLDITKKKHNEWSEPRKRLSDKGIIDCKTRGMIKIKVPRFKEFIQQYDE